VKKKYIEIFIITSDFAMDSQGLDIACMQKEDDLS
jgi:hypothetical protein